MAGNPGAALFTRRAAGRAAAPKVALGDTNFELAQAPVNPRRERMDDPEFQTDDARNVEPHKVQAKSLIPILQDVEDLKARFEALKGSGDPEKEKALDDITSAFDLVTHHVLDITEDKGAPKKARISGDETVITLKVRPGTEQTLLPLLENLQLLGQWGASREVVIDDFSDRPEKDGDGRHFFDGDGSDQIFDIKVEKSKPKKARLFQRQALVKLHTTPPKGAPREDQRTHLDADVQAELDAEKDPDLIRHTTGKSSSIHVNNKCPGCGDEVRCKCASLIHKQLPRTANLCQTCKGKTAAGVPLLEALAALEHQQWVEWSKDIASSEDLSDERVDRWEEAWVAYSALSDEEKEKDRVYARKIIKLLEKKGISLQKSKEAGRLFS